MYGFLSREATARHGVAKSHTVTQVMLQIHQTATMQTESTIDWDKICNQVEASNPYIHGLIQPMTYFVAAWSGGKDPIFVQQLDDWSKPLCSKRWSKHKNKNENTTTNIFLNINK